MNRMVTKRSNKSVGAALLTAAVVAFFIYAYFLLLSDYSMMIIQFTVLAAVGILLAVLGWIGYTMLTAPKEDATPA